MAFHGGFFRRAFFRGRTPIIAGLQKVEDAVETLPVVGPAATAFRETIQTVEQRVERKARTGVIIIGGILLVGVFILFSQRQRIATVGRAAIAGGIVGGPAGAAGGALAAGLAPPPPPLP